MNKTRIWIFGAVAAMLIIVVGGWTLGISPVFSQISQADAQLASSQASGQASQAQLATLRVQYDGISKLKKKLNALRLSVPETQAASVLINEITAFGISTGVSVQSVTIATATLYSAPVAVAPAGTAAATSTPAPTATPAVTPTVGAPTSTTASGLVLIPVTIEVKGALENTRLFISAIQTGPRLLVASMVNLTTSGNTATATITGTVFTQQGTSDPSPKTKLAPVPTPTATPTPTLTPTPTPTNSTTTSSTKSDKTNTAPVVQPTTAPPPAAPDPDPTPTP